MLRLARGDWTAALLPDRGAAFARLEWRGRPVLVPLSPDADPTAAFEGAFVMAPWANRLDAGRLPADDAVHRLPVNRIWDDTAIHGFARDRPWSIEQAGPAGAVLSLHLADTASAPFRVALRMAIRLDRAGLALALRLRNLGPVALPMGLGWHPWFVCPAGTRLRFAAGVRFRHDARVLPTAAEPTRGVDGTDQAYRGLDTHFAEWDGVADIMRGDHRLRMRATGAWARNLQVFAPVGAGVLCLEPVSHVPDAPNRPSLARYGPLRPLAPGRSMAARVRLTAEPT